MAVVPHRSASPSTSLAGRHVSGSVTWNVLNLVRQGAGEKGVAELLERAGSLRSADELADDGTWISFEEGRALFEAATQVLGEDEALRRVGEAILRRDMTSEVAELLRGLGSVGEVLGQIELVAPKFCTVTEMAVVAVETDRAVVDARSVPGFERFPQLCDLTAGLLSQASIPFGLPPAEVRETSCEALGDDRCRFDVRWESQLPTHVEARMADLESEVQVLAARFESFQQTAADLVAAEDVDAVLDNIASRAGLSVRAPRHILAISPTPGADLVVHQIGCDENDLDELVADVMAEDPDDHGGSRLIVEVASVRRDYGRLAAIYDEGARFFEAERFLLAGYGRLAAAALDTAVALDESRQQAVTAQGLLDLARELAAPGEPASMAVHVARAVTAVVGCDLAAVLLWSEERGCLETAAVEGGDAALEATLRGTAVTPADTAALREMLRSGLSATFDTSTDDAFVRSLLDLAGMECALVSPLTAGDSLLGLVAASFIHRPVDHRPSAARLEGITDIAAIAIQNATLVRKMREQALYDPVTHLPNRRLLEDRLASAFAHQRRSGGGGFALLFLDLDRFKNVNDNFGHAAGDELLLQVAHRLRSRMREQDTLARIGGDEFALLLLGVETMEAVNLLTTRLHDAFQASFAVGGREIFVTASIGVVRAPEHGTDYDTLLERADVAMYQAKRAGRNRFGFYTAALGADTERVRLEYDLHGALERDELFLEYQPLVSLDDGRIRGVEALVRWQHPELGRLMPDVFIGVAEESDLIVAVDTWVLEHAVRQARAWHEAGHALRIGVNLADRDLRESDLVGRIRYLLSATGLPPGALELEVTERVVGEELDDLLSTLRVLRDLGVRTAIDDFGTGHSGLERLSRLPVDTVKVDRIFVQDIADLDRPSPIVSAMIKLSHELGMTVVAEGVETEVQARFLQREGCEEGQGYHFARPLATADVHRLLLAELAGETTNTGRRGATPSSPAE